MKVSQVMKTIVVTATPTTTLVEAAKAMTKNRVGSLVIVDNRKPVGIVTSEDIVSAVANDLNPQKFAVKDIPHKDFITVSPDHDIMSLTKLMIKTGVKRVPVVQNDQLLGIVSEKEIILTAPEMIDILSEKLKVRVENTAAPDTITSGICERCEGYSDKLCHVNDMWICEHCCE